MRSFCLGYELSDYWLAHYKVDQQQDFWNDFVKWTKNTGLSLTNLNKLQIMLGSFEKSDDFKLVNHLLIIAK